MNILIVDDNMNFLNDLEMLLSSKHTCFLARTTEEASCILEREEIEVLLLDINLGAGTDGLTFLMEVKAGWPFLVVIMITEDERVSTVVKAMRNGASGYVGKQPDLASLRVSIMKAMRDAEVARDRDLYRSEIDQRWENIVGSSPAILAVREHIERAACVQANVLLAGESGTGKELVARAIHKRSAEADLPFVAVNCAAIPKDLFESELLGHEKGAFTGAIGRQIGKFEQARQGTIFLDEISEIPLEQQAKLLRVLQERRFYRVGGRHELESKARVIASSNRNLKEAIEKGLFREDLFYRLKVLEIRIPPLRERREDICELIDFFLIKKAQEMKRRPPVLTAAAREVLMQYRWPGNVRELENCVEAAIVRCTGNTIDTDILREYTGSDLARYSSYEEAKRDYLERFQREYIGRILALTEGNVTQAADKMGVSRQGLLKMMKSCGITIKN